MNKETGEPSLSSQDMDAGRRFPDDVRQVLTGAGWRAGRNVGASVSAWLRELYAAEPETEARLPVFTVAYDLLAEFGGLSFRQLKRLGVHTGGFDVQFWPYLPGRVFTELFAEFAADLGTPVFPIAWYEDGPSDFVVAADGRVFLLHEAGEFLVGATPDEAMTSLVRGEAFAEVDEHGEVVPH